MSTDPILRGVAISRFAGAWLNAIEDFLDADRGWSDILKPEVYDAIKKDAEELLPHFHTLNGRGLRARAGDAGSMRLGQGTDRSV